MSQGLPGRVNVARLAARSARVDSVTPVSAMERFRTVLADDSGTVESALAFSVDEQSRMKVSGTARAGVQVVCQRCLEPMPLVVEAAFELLLFDNETADDVGSDAVVVERGEVSPLELVEDELILAMPIVTRHGDGEHCAARHES